MSDSALKTVTVLGSGIMGAGIAQVAAMGGLDTFLYDVNEAALEKARGVIAGSLKKLAEKGKFPAADVEATLARVRTTTDFAAAVTPSDFVIEAIPEKLDLKQRTFVELERLTRPGVPLGSNTSSLMISAIAEPLRDKGRVIGVHFFNPVPVMRLIEIVLGPDSSPQALAATEALAKVMGKETVRVKEAPGFATSRINALIGLEAFRMLESGIASAEDIDKALKLGLNHPMGPFEMADLVGLDTRLSTIRYLHKTLGETFRPSPLMEKLVEEGRLGRKVGRGVYTYDAKGNRIPDATP